MKPEALLPFIGALAAATSAGALCAWLGTPLPWMIGPLVALAVLQFSGTSLRAPPLGREAGQLFIAMALGLYFSPTVAREVLVHAPVLAALAAGVFLVGVASSVFLAWAAGTDRATAYFASAIGGASEMVVLADRNGGKADQVAIAHSLRILVVVTSVPVAITLLGQTGTDDYQPIAAPFDAGTFALHTIGAILVGLAWRRLQFPNAFMMGPLLLTIGLASAGTPLSAVPGWLVNAAQVLLACNLGMRFQQRFLREAPRFVMASLASIAVMLVLATGLALAVATAFALIPATSLLAAAPGGIAEMAITAKVLQVGVAFVTAAHVLRFVIVMLLTEPAWRLYARRSSRQA